MPAQALQQDCRAIDFAIRIRLSAPFRNALSTPTVLLPLLDVNRPQHPQHHVGLARLGLGNQAVDHILARR